MISNSLHKIPNSLRSLVPRASKAPTRKHPRPQGYICSFDLGGVAVCVLASEEDYKRGVQATGDTEVTWITTPCQRGAEPFYQRYLVRTPNVHFKLVKSFDASVKADWDWFRWYRRLF